MFKKCKRLFYKFTRGFYHARKFLAVFGMVFALLVCSVFLVSAETIGSVFGTEMLYSVGIEYNSFVRFNSNAGWNAVPFEFYSPLNMIITSYGVGDLLPSNCNYLNMVIQSKDNNEGLLIIYPGETVTFSMDFEISSLQEELLPSTPNINVFTSFEFALRCSLGDSDEDYFISQLYNFTKNEKTATVSLTYTNDTANFLRVRNSAISAYFPAGSFSDLTNFYFGNVKYKVWTEAEKSSIAFQQAIKDQTDTITNGYDSQPKDPSGSENVDDLNNAEQDLLDSQQQGLDEYNNIASGVGDMLVTYQAGFAAIGNLLMEFVYLPFFLPIVYISLTFGIFGLLVGLGITLYNRAERHARTERSRGKKGG